MAKICHDCVTFLPAGRTRSVWPAGPKITFRFPHLLVYMYVRTYHVHIVAMWPYFILVDFGNLDGCFVYLLWVVYHSYEFEMDTESRGNVDTMTRGWLRVETPDCEQLLVVPMDLLTNRVWLSGVLLSGSERWRPGWFLDMKYQTCFAEYGKIR